MSAYPGKKKFFLNKIFVQKEKFRTPKKSHFTVQINKENSLFTCLYIMKKNMTKKTIAPGVVHKVPADLKETLVSKSDVLEKWNSLTPLARNEWICWITIVKKPETRKEHIDRLCEDLIKGKRRPCCWPGCPHRRPNAQKWFKESVDSSS